MTVLLSDTNDETAKRFSMKNMNRLFLYFLICSFRSVKINYTTLTDLNTKYPVMCKVYTDVGGIKQLYHVCPPICKIIHLLKLVDYLHVQADKPWYNYYIMFVLIICGL